MSGERIVGDVASIVVAEGEAGVRDVIRTVARLEPVAVRTVSRATELPVPFVSAICNELRKRGIVSTQRPVQLTAHGRDVFGGNSLRLPLEAACSACSRREIVVSPSLEPLVHELAAFADAAPPARLDIDQTHCTVETKIRRVLALYEAGALEDRRILLLGDDDLTALAISLVVQQLGSRATVRGVTVVDVDPALLDFLRRALVDAPFPVELVRHDLREPLPAPPAGPTPSLPTRRTRTPAPRSSSRGLPRPRPGAHAPTSSCRSARASRKRRSSCSARSARWGSSSAR